VSCMPSIFVAFVGLVENDSKGWGIRIRTGTISLRIPIHLSDSKPNCAIILDLDHLVMRNNTPIATQKGKSKLPSTENIILASTIPIMVRAYVRALQRNSVRSPSLSLCLFRKKQLSVSSKQNKTEKHFRNTTLQVLGENARWPPTMNLDVGKLFVGVQNCNDENNWIGRVDFDGLDVALSLDGRWLDDESGQRPWPMNLPPVLTCCVTTGMMRLRGLSSSSSFEMNAFIDHISRALSSSSSSSSSSVTKEEKEVIVETATYVDRVAMPSNLTDTSVNWSKFMLYLTDALSDLIRVNQHAIVMRPGESRKREKLPPFLGVFLLRAIGFECKTPLTTKAQMFRFRTNGPVEMSVHSFASHEEKKVFTIAPSPSMKTKTNSNKKKFNVDDEDETEWSRIQNDIRVKRGQEVVSPSQIRRRRRSNLFSMIAKKRNSGRKRTKRRIFSNTANKMSSALRKLGLGKRRNKIKSNHTSLSVTEDETLEGLVCPICRTQHITIAALKSHFETYHSMEQHQQPKKKSEIRSPPPPPPPTQSVMSELKCSPEFLKKKEVFDGVLLVSSESVMVNSDSVSVVRSESSVTTKTESAEKKIKSPPIQENNKSVESDSRTLEITEIDKDKLPIRVSLPLVAALTCLGIVTLSQDGKDDDEKSDTPQNIRVEEAASFGENVPWLNLCESTSNLTLTANLVTRTCSSSDEARSILSILRSAMNSNSVWIETLRDMLLGCGNVFGSSNTFLNDDKMRFEIQRSKVIRSIGIGKKNMFRADSTKMIETLATTPLKKKKTLSPRSTKMDDDMMEYEDDEIFGDMKLKMTEESPVVAIAREQRNAGLITNTEFDLIIEKDRHFQRQAMLDRMKTTPKRDVISPPSKPTLALHMSSLMASWSPERYAVFYEAQIGVQSTSGGSSSWKTVGGTEKCEFCFKRLKDQYTYVCRIRFLTKSQRWSSYSLASNAVKYVVSSAATASSSSSSSLSKIKCELRKIEEMGLLAVWQSIPKALQYEVQVRQVSTSKWRTVGGTSKSQFLIQGLDRGRRYESRVRSLLEDRGWSLFSNVSNSMVFE